MVGRPGPLGMMGKELVVRCTAGTCDRECVAWWNWMACRSVSKEVWCTGCIACPCALHVHWAILNVRGLSTRCYRWLMPELKVCCLQVCADRMGEKNRWTAAAAAAAVVVAPLWRWVLLVRRRESGSVWLYMDDPYRHEPRVWCPQEMAVGLTRRFHPAMNLEIKQNE